MWKLASRKRFCIVAFALFPVLLRLAFLPWIPPPQPGIQDEFSYLLAGDTFASGRLTNPPHPFWVFFESVNIIQQPTYMSKYPPLQGLILAFGERVFGHPWIGVLLSMGMLCGAIAWALQNWLPPFWALIGTAIAVLKIGILSYWTESYWGGNGAAIGGALLIGSLPGLIRRPSLWRGMPASVGIALLANSRPFEGLVLILVCLGYAAWRIVRRSTTPLGWFTDLNRSIAAPLLMVMVPVAAWMAFYNYRATGSAFLMPYTVHEREYTVASAFPWDNPRTPPAYRHEALQQTWVGWDLNTRILQRKFFWLTRLGFFATLANFFFGIPLMIVIVGCAPAMVKRRRMREALWLAMLFAVGLDLELGFFPHYAAPATALFYIVASGALRTLRHHWPSWALPARLVCGTALVAMTVQLMAGPFLSEHRFLYDKRDFQTERAGVMEFLNGVPGQQLVFVGYGPKHDINDEWVYNRANIDGSAVVWARSMGREKDLALISYFKDRHVWLLDENGAARISSYGASGDTVLHSVP